MDYSYEKNSLDFGVDATQNGRLAAILDFCYNILHMDHMQHGGATYRMSTKNSGKLIALQRYALY